MSIKAINEYNKVGVKSGVDQATPHRMVQMLLEGALTRIAIAKGHMERNELAQQGEEIGKAITIVGGLQATLDPEKGGDVAGNLDYLYDHIAQGLMQANSESSTDKLDQITNLLIEIKSGWDAIPVEHHQTTALTDEAGG
ncbi:flagellar export chaperone FliS [Motiliproteus coralliicola]|uniref:Flagellar secretion chaperone FliS n=1 Tax=Motiliproteus coralliicola TaxID=2283196 RepID=A0A369WL96_9GAMM|nr:flagellar export chaperone FliS [Motiliproteus coralliicola]RDE22397.1 flagellar export chaperone FliS [Motiliproteus coralliicola]